MRLSTKRKEHMYKEGDKVYIRDDIAEVYDCPAGKTPEMDQYAGCLATIESTISVEAQNTNGYNWDDPDSPDPDAMITMYYIDVDGHNYTWDDTLFVSVKHVKLKDYSVNYRYEVEGTIEITARSQENAVEEITKAMNKGGHHNAIMLPTVKSYTEKERSKVWPS